MNTPETMQELVKAAEKQGPHSMLQTQVLLESGGGNAPWLGGKAEERLRRFNLRLPGPEAGMDGVGVHFE